MNIINIASNTNVIHPIENPLDAASAPPAEGEPEAARSPIKAVDWNALPVQINSKAMERAKTNQVAGRALLALSAILGAITVYAAFCFTATPATVLTVVSGLAFLTLAFAVTGFVLTYFFSDVADEDNSEAMQNKRLQARDALVDLNAERERMTRELQAFESNSNGTYIDFRKHNGIQAIRYAFTAEGQPQTRLRTSFLNSLDQLISPEFKEDFQIMGIDRSAMDQAEEAYSSGCNDAARETANTIKEAQSFLGITEKQIHVAHLQQNLNQSVLLLRQLEEKLETQSARKKELEHKRLPYSSEYRDIRQGKIRELSGKKKHLNTQICEVDVEMNAYKTSSQVCAMNAYITKLEVDLKNLNTLSIKTGEIDRIKEKKSTIEKRILALKNRINQPIALFEQDKSVLQDTLRDTETKLNIFSEYDKLYKEIMELGKSILELRERVKSNLEVKAKDSLILTNAGSELNQALSELAKVQAEAKIREFSRRNELKRVRDEALKKAVEDIKSGFQNNGNAQSETIHAPGGAIAV